MDASAVVALPVNAPGVVAFNLQRDLIWLLHQAIIFGVPIAFVVTGLAARVRTRVVAFTSGVHQFTFGVFLVISVIALLLIQLPVAYWLDIAHQRAGDAPEVVPWLLNQLITAFQSFLYALIAALVLPIPMILFPKRWWLVIAVAAVPVLAYTMTRAPSSDQSAADVKYVEIASDSVAGLLRRCGLRNIPIMIGGDVSHIDGGRIVLAADDAARMSDAQFLGTVAREMKHSLSSDNLTTVAVAVILFSGGMFIVYLVAGGFVRRFGARARIARVDDVILIPVLFAVGGFYWTFVATPVLNTMHRSSALEADRFALEITHASDPLAALYASAAKSSPGRLVDYYPLYTYLWATEPSDAERVALANTYKPWEQGQPGKYDNLCKPAPKPAG